ncbi:helix-turn-helix domain-containing protein [Microvirga arsenatis]|uniref:helix-turn-helix domain-containing protein n=1 Tax=Microvirga arsenatis TaxID=2692265 RepID=UPI0031B64433
MRQDTDLERRAAEFAHRFGSLVRERRRALGLLQDQVALATGVGRRFLIDLEAGKPTCQIGRSLLVAEALGLRLTDALAVLAEGTATPSDELPDVPEEED